MVSPGDETAGAERHDRLRASAADREQVIEVLKVAFVQCRISRDELSQRIGKVLASQTYDDLNALTADIPGGLTRAQPPVPARRPGVGRKAIWRASAAVGGTVFVLTEVRANPHFPGFGILLGPVVGAFVAGLVAVLLTFIAGAIDRSADRQRSRGAPPGARDKAAQRPAPAGQAGQPAQISRPPGPGTEATRSRQTRSRLAGLRPARWLRSLMAPA